MTIYPDIRFAAYQTSDGDYITRISTNVRKLHTDGKWYTQYFFREERGDRDSVQFCLNLFTRDIYLAQLFGKVMPELEGLYGPLFKLDEDQRSEEERLKQ